MGKIPGRPASPRPAGLAPPQARPRLRTSDNVTQSRGSKSRVRPWLHWKHRKASTSIQRFTRQPKITKIAGTYFPGDYPRAEQSLSQVRGRDGPEEGGWPSNCNCQSKPTTNRLQERIRDIVRKAVDTWRHLLAFLSVTTRSG